MTRSDPDYAAALAPRRRPWKVALPLILVLVLAAGWSGFWYFAAQTAERLLEEWRARQAQAGRVITCGQQTVGGFPFRIEVRCTDVAVEILSANAPTVALRLKEIVALAQVYDPRLIISEFIGPLQVGAPGATPELTANWTLAQSSLRGRPSFPERVSFVADGLKIDEVATARRMAQADHLEFHARLAPAVAGDEPAFDIVLRATAALAPQAGPLGTRPTDADITAVLYGLKTLAPKPMAQRLREWQAANGRIDIKTARFQQGETVGVAAGVLSLTPRGGLDGTLRLTASGLNNLLTALGHAKLAGGLTVLSGLGPRSELEGKQALSVPLRFSDGAVSLGPLPVERIPPLF